MRTPAEGRPPSVTPPYPSYPPPHLSVGFFVPIVPRASTPTPTRAHACEYFMRYMSIIHFIMYQYYSILAIKRLVDRTASGTMGSTHEAKEMIMRAYGHVSVWRTLIGVGRAADGQGWYQQLKAWWADHKATRREANLATLRARWDARREAVRPLHTDAAIDMVASTHAFSTTTTLCDLAV